MRTFRLHPAHAGRQRAVELRARLGRELRIARMATGLTQRVAGHRAGLSQSAYSQLERSSRSFSLDAYARAAAAVGTELSIRVYPVATVTLRDRGQLALAQRIAAAAARGLEAQLEAPIADGDQRAADVLMSGPRELWMMEIYRSVTDLQAQLRAAHLKREALASRHHRPVRLIIVVPDTTTTRRAVRHLAPLLARTMPIPSAVIWKALRDGTAIGGDGILFVRPRRLPQPSPITPGATPAPRR